MHVNARSTLTIAVYPFVICLPRVYHSAILLFNEFDLLFLQEVWSLHCIFFCFQPISLILHCFRRLLGHLAVPASVPQNMPNLFPFFLCYFRVLCRWILVGVISSSSSIDICVNWCKTRSLIFVLPILCGGEEINLTNARRPICKRRRRLPRWNNLYRDDAASHTSTWLWTLDNDVDGGHSKPARLMTFDALQI